MPLDEDMVAAICREHGPALRRFVLSACRDRQLVRGCGPGNDAPGLAAGADITGSLRSYLFGRRATS